ncbi:MAG: carboxypeptidase-like regulatory domain-containing protein, partial [Acidobacteriia bacterium]|nr:carboxypeptidase-like regulatory domain-containing protein [Terriglobia bacterium]
SGRQLSPRGGALTDDQGAYRLFGVTPGKYYLRASPPMRRGSDEEETFVASYYPNALDPTGAAPVELRPGQEMRGIDLAVRRARAITVRGRVIKPAGAASVQLGLTQLVEGGGSMNTNTDLRDQEGKFEWRGMLPGSYAISAQATVGDRRYSARYSLQAGSSDIDNIELRLAQAPELKGIIRIEGSADVQPSRVMVRFEGRSGRSTSTMASRIMMGDGRILSSSGGVGEDGTFTVPALDPDFYRISVTAPGNLFLQSATCGNADVIEAGLDLSGGAACDLTVVVSANAGQVDGQVSDENSQPATAARVALVPTGSRRTDLFKTAVADPNGHFTIQGVAPGSYKVYAWEEVDMNAVHYDPEFVKPYESSGQSVHINEGSKETVNLKQIKTPAER